MHNVLIKRGKRRLDEKRSATKREMLILQLCYVSLIIQAHGARREDATSCVQKMQIPYLHGKNGRKTNRSWIGKNRGRKYLFSINTVDMSMCISKG